MPRSIWSGAISFGLVNVPVKLYSAVSRKTVRFHQLHDADHVRIQQKRVCPADGEEVPYDNIVKGYEISPDQYVVVEPEELEALDPKKTRSIDIQEFVDLSEIDPIYFDHPYYLAPGTGASKAYRLLLQAMQETGKVAIARVVIRQKENLVAIRATGDVMTMATMVFHDEVIDPDTIDEIPDDDAKATKREVEMAQQLIDSLSGEFEPEKYHDEYRERVLELIEAKAAGEEITIQPPEEPAKVPDLMAALEQSLAAAKGNGDTKASSGTKRKRSTSASSGNGSKTGSGTAKKKSTSTRSRSKASSKK
ncbi:MAG TPA: Ku protein [Thermoleophilaceae bacterium]|jgi:DNA end-binding protein Ku